MYLYNNKTIVLHELIGTKVKVIMSSDILQKNIKGVIIDETKNSFLIDTPTGVKRIIKNISTFAFKINRNIFIIDGKEINFRSYERIDKGIKYYKLREIK
ncbi:MAG: ribonuclease P protein component 1 [Candidatus Micrarchaeia archaeon]